MKWLCGQIGAREHYAVPRALREDGRLQMLYTDFWAGPACQILARLIPHPRFRSLAARAHPGLASNSVCAWNIRSLWIDRQSNRLAGSDAYVRFVSVGSAFSTNVRAALRQRTDLDPDTVFFSYDTGALEAMEYCRERGVRCVLDQMDPNRLEVELVQAEEKSWPGWASAALNVPETYFRRRQQEWAVADLVVVNSEFSRQALLAQNVPAKKLVVVPLCFEGIQSSVNVARHSRLPIASSAAGHSSKPLRVLFLGQVILRKGIQYLMEAARLLEQENVHFDVVGPVGISPAAVRTTPKNMTIHGRTTRDQAAQWYEQSDVFVLPTLSDGFALTQLEAMAFGLPVVATANCGAVVTDGRDGFIVPSRNGDALAKAILRYLEEPGLLVAHGTAALEKSKEFGMNQLISNLRSVEARLKTS